MTLTESSRKGGALTQFRQVYCWQLKRNRAISILYAVLTLLLVTVLHLSESVMAYRRYFNHANDWENFTDAQIAQMFSNDVASSFKTVISVMFIPITLIFLVVLTVRTFRYMHSRRSVDLFHALPIQRTPLLLGGLAAIYTILGAGALLNILICGIVDLAMGVGDPFTAAWLLGNLGYLLLLLAASLLWTVFLLVACGTVSNAVLAGIFLGTGWPILCICGASIIRTSLPGSSLVASGAVISALVPYLALFIPYRPDVVFMLMSVRADQEGNFATVGVWLVLWWVLVTVLLLVGCILVYRKRKSETAENHFSYPVLRVSIRFLVSVAFGLGCGCIFGDLFQSNAVFYVAVVLGSLLAHGVTQVIWVRDVRQIVRSLPAYGGLVACMAVFFVTLLTGGLGYVNRVPNLENVDYARVNLPMSYHFDNSVTSYLKNCELCVDYVDLDNMANLLELDPKTENVETLDGEIMVYPKLTQQSSLEAAKALQQSLIDLFDAPYLPVQKDFDAECAVEYHLKNGKTMTRVYQIPNKDVDYENFEEYRQEQRATPEVLKQMAKVVAQDEWQKLGLFDQLTADRVSETGFERNTETQSITGSVGETLTAAQKKKLWNTFCQELASDQFVYTFQDENGLPEGKTSYWISVDNVWKEQDWTEEMRQMIAENSEEGQYDPEHQKLIKLYTNSNYFNVPECCTKTRALIKEYVGDNVFLENYDEKEIE